MSREISDLLTITKTTTKKYTFYQVVLCFMEFTELYKEVRKNHKYKGFKCFKCNKPFELGESVSVGFSNKGNKTLCCKCAEEIKSYLNEAKP